MKMQMTVKQMSRIAKDVRHLTPAARGIFWNLCFPWLLEEPTPGSDEEVCQLAHCGMHEWEQVKEEVLPLFPGLKANLNQH